MPKLLKIGSSGFSEETAIDDDYLPVVLAKGSASAVATLDIDFTSYYASYDILEVHIFGLRPVTDATTLYLRFSADASAYDAGASDYSWAFNVTNTTSSTGSFDAADNQIRLTQNTNAGNAADEHANVVLTIRNASNAALRQVVGWRTDYLDTGGLSITVQGTGNRLAAQDLQAIRILYSSGNIAAAQYKVIGYKN